MMIPSSKLLEAYLPYIDHTTCRNMYKNGFELFVTSDKFCAGSQSPGNIQIYKNLMILIFFL